MSDHEILTAKWQNEKATDMIVSKAYVYVLGSFVNVTSHDLNTMAGCEIKSCGAALVSSAMALNSQQCKYPKS